VSTRLGSGDQGRAQMTQIRVPVALIPACTPRIGRATAFCVPAVGRSTWCHRARAERADRLVAGSVHGGVRLRERILGVLLAPEPPRRVGPSWLPGADRSMRTHPLFPTADDPGRTGAGEAGEPKAPMRSAGSPAAGVSDRSGWLS
jgi:hypothetical protein